MPEITARLSTALADRYRIERHLGYDPPQRRNPIVVLNWFEELRAKVGN